MRFSIGSGQKPKPPRRIESRGEHANEIPDLASQQSFSLRFSAERRSTIDRQRQRRREEANRRQKRRCATCAHVCARGHTDAAAQKGTIAIPRYHGTATCRGPNISVMSW